MFICEHCSRQSKENEKPTIVPVEMRRVSYLHPDGSTTHGVEYARTEMWCWFCQVEPALPRYVEPKVVVLKPTDKRVLASTHVD